jgi:SAM-dependent methyltransferase
VEFIRFIGESSVKTQVLMLLNKVESKQRQLVTQAFCNAKAYAQLYEGDTPVARFFNERQERVLEILSSVGNGKVLNVGCGPGKLLTCLAGKRFQVFGLDCTPAMVAEAKERTSGLGVDLTLGWLERLPFSTESFDVILALGVLEYLPDLQVGLSEIARVAKPNAVIIVSMLNKLSLYYLWHGFIWRPLTTLRRLLCGRGMGDEPALQLHGAESMMRMLRACQIEPVNVDYFDVNVCIPPLDAKYPRRAVAINDWIENRCGNRSPRVLQTGFILNARKATD